MNEQQFFLMVMGTFLLLGVIFALVPIIMAKSRKKKASKCDRMTTATIVEYMCYHGDTTDTYAPVYSYFVDGTEYRKTSNNSSSIIKSEIGDKVALQYNSENPNMIYVEEEQHIEKFISIIFGIISAIMIIVSIAVGVSGLIGR